MKTNRMFVALIAAGLFSLSCAAGAVDSGISTSSFSATSTATTVVPLHFERRCPKGGTSVMDGSYDTVSGKVTITATVSACAMWNGEVQDGSTKVTGTLIPGTGQIVNIDMGTVDTLTVTRNGNTVTNTCTLVKQGTFDQATHVFTGKNASTCSTDGAVRDREGLVEYLLRRSEVLASSSSTTQ